MYIYAWLSQAWAKGLSHPWKILIAVKGNYVTRAPTTMAQGGILAPVLVLWFVTEKEVKSGNT